MDLSIQWMRACDLKGSPHNARVHSKRQVKKLASTIRAVGFRVPLLVDEDGVIIAGHGRLEAAKSLGMRKVPVIVHSDLTEAQKRALIIADNKLTESAGWDRDKLLVELQELEVVLPELGLEIPDLGFEVAELDQLHADLAGGADPADTPNPKTLDGPAVTVPGDLWLLGPHRLLCGDARDLEQVRRLMNGERATAAFLDPPYNVRVRDIVGRGKRKHREFAMGSGEMGSTEFAEFLQTTLGNAEKVSADGAVHYVCMDWRHIGHLLEAAEGVYGEYLNLAVWVKNNAGQGSFYRSQHELVLVARVGSGPHQNHVELGKHGRNRSNVWHYVGANSFRAGRLDDLSAHPTVKPIALVADALKDCTSRGDLVLDVFAGSGTTILAAERVGRRAAALEIDPAYVDIAVRRWQALSKRDAVHAETGKSFDECAAERHSSAA